MVLIRTVIASLILALGVAAVPAPASEPEPQTSRVFAPVNFERDEESSSDFSYANSTSVTASSTPTTDTSSRPPIPPGPPPGLTCDTIQCIKPWVCQNIDGKPGCYQKCGSGYCPYNTTCCNAGCNTCAPPGMMCTQPVCNSESATEPLPDPNSQL
ncbi:hypothetical protein LZ32DRAFT_601604 [Colletotrichum eremochloae]|nr:hypothetical protein LZ32DRAFT_601604 [Colletotrichum eremochloae]